VLQGHKAAHSPPTVRERFQSKVLRMIVVAPWYVPNTVIRRDLQRPTVKEEIRRYSSQYNARLSAHPNGLIVNLMELPVRRHLPKCVCVCAHTLAASSLPLLEAPGEGIFWNLGVRMSHSI
jgi:hypothetical protein